jgi:luciferase family oxidoreductase group 1
MIPFSILDLCPIADGGSASQSLRNSLDLAQNAEEWGFNRFWLAEHHGMPGIASAATAVLIGQVAAATSRIRVGAGGIMLPNHAPLVVAEQFGTLEALFPGRIDLGLGRAPGTDPATARALRRTLESDPERFPEDVSELMSYFRPSQPGQTVRAVPGEGLDVPVWILGSSLFGAQLAAAMGLPYAFASHFAPAQMMEAIDLYRHLFRPSEHLERPYVMLGYNVFAADSDEEAGFLASSMKQAFLNLRRGRPTPLPAPVENFDERLTPSERELLGQIMACSAIGSPETVREELAAFIERTAPDEIMIATQMHDHDKRLRSYRIAAEARARLA